MYMLNLFLLPLILLLCLLGPATSAAGDIRQERVQFPKGEIGISIKDHIKGYQIVDYKLRAQAGQYMIAGLKTDNLSNYFNVMAPGETAVAFFIGSVEGNRFEGELPENGDYTIRVYLMRNAARRNEKAHYTLEAAIAAAGDVPSEADDGKRKHRNTQKHSEKDALVAPLPTSMQQVKSPAHVTKDKP